MVLSYYLITWLMENSSASFQCILGTGLEVGLYFNFHVGFKCNSQPLLGHED